jgi:hypothetical protein
MTTPQKEYLELMSQITCDTLLNIKYSTNGKVSWCKYWIPTTRKNGTPVLFGKLYAYFSKKEGFCFGLGTLAVN